MTSPFLITLLSCTTDTDGVTVEDYVPPVELSLPSLDGIDVESAFTEAISRVGKVQLNPAWNGNKESLALKRPTCPDVYVGAPEFLDNAVDDSLIWDDFCSTGTGLRFGGHTLWKGTLEQNGDPTTQTGLTINGTRQMEAQASVAIANDVIYEFKGTGSDALYRVQAPGYERWTYSAEINGSISGSQSTGENEGFRTDMYIYASGGDSETLDARGNVFWFDYRIQDRFDSAAMDIYLVNGSSAGPDDCPLEPKGWIGLRDENAFWYDLVFMPQDSNDDAGYEDEDRSVCDGCGTLYLRGLETENYGEICPDFSTIWTDNLIILPDAEDFVLTLQQLPPQE
ncbi:MAG: hypothetical protein VX278_15050 [Myxococcota bacterium]|nr:hypothetical protein [Myxococcota bacterium]